MAMAPEIEQAIADFPPPAQKVLRAMYDMAYAEGFTAGFVAAQQECIALIEQGQRNRANQKSH